MSSRLFHLSFGTALFLASGLVPPSPAQAGKAPVCREKYAELSPTFATKDAALSFLGKLIDSHGSVEWQEGKAANVKTTKALAALVSLSDEEKAHLLLRLRKAYPGLKKAPPLLRLGLGDSVAWEAFFRETSSEPSKFLPMLGGLRPLVEKMPPDLREELLGEIGRLYSRAGKMPTDVRDGKFYPKRLLDAWLRVLLPGDDVFQGAVAKGKSPLKAYQGYLDQVNGSVISQIPKAEAQGYGQLGAKDLQGIGQEIQRFLNLPSTKKYLYANVLDDGEKMTPRIRVFGSTVKGMSKQGSDLDLGFEYLDPRFNEGLDGQAPGLAQQLRAYLAKKLPGVSLELDGQAHALSQVDEGLTALEPFMLEITPKKVELLVYPHQVELKPKPYSKQMIYAAPAPQRYDLGR